MLDDRRRRAVWLDMACPAHRIYRFTHHQVYREQDEVAATIRRALGVNGA